MNKPDVRKIAKGIWATASKKSPEILTAIGVSSFVGTAILVGTATPKAMRAIDEKKDELQVDELTKTETFKAVWKLYIPAFVTGGIGIACIIGANNVNVRRNAALAAAYTLSDNALREYKDSVKEVIGEKKEQIVKDKVAEHKLEKRPVSKSEVIVTKHGTTLCYDAIGGRYFNSDIETIKQVQNELNRRMMYEMYISLNEFYDEVDLPHTRLGDQLGWNVDEGLIEFDFSSQIAEDGRPCLVVDYSVAPRYGYDRIAR